VGGLYVARKYLRDRLEEVKDNMELERVAKERYVTFFSVDGLCHGIHAVLLRSAPSSSFRHILNARLIEITLCLRTFSKFNLSIRPMKLMFTFFSLQKRFRQTQEDTSYTILALLPTLSEQILGTMDVETLTNELQARSRARNAILVSPSIPPPLALPTPSYLLPPSSLSSGIELVNPTASQEEDSRSEVGSIAHSQVSDDHSASHSQMSESFTSASGSVTQSWVESSGSVPRSAHSPAPSGSALSSARESVDEQGQEMRSEAGSGVEQESVVSVVNVCRV